ncbi:heavy metal translocating P-type ATPase [Natrarchaeobius sp. A-rgal3]|uniref:heavy metal translocating P-type ATPase n=1 Tax=Natrarchaeobius versutus TaxID=1679078 RepID=UPI00350F5087
MTCTLCELPTGSSPITDDDLEAEFCCRGCLAVYRALEGGEGGGESKIGSRDDEPPSVNAGNDEPPSVNAGNDEPPSVNAGNDEPTRVDARADDPPSVDDGSDEPRRIGAGDDETPGLDRRDDGASSDVDRDDHEIAHFSIEGMHCKTCERYLEAVATGIEGVVDAHSSYATELMSVRYDPAAWTVDDLADELSGLGYRASAPDEERVNDRLTIGRYRVALAVLVMMPVMAPYLLFIYPTYLGIYPREFLFDPTLTAVVYVPLFVWSTLVVAGLGYPILRGAAVSLRVGRANTDLLIALAVLAAYGYSVAALGVGRRDVYFDVAVMILVVVTVGNHVETRLKRRALETNVGLATPDGEGVRRLEADGSLESVGFDDLEPGDTVLVRPGERVPVDGTIVGGSAWIDESILTGESVPRHASAGATVRGGAVVEDGALTVDVGDEVESTRIRLGELLSVARSSNDGIGRVSDRLAAAFVPLVIAVAVATTAVWIAAGSSVGTAILIGVSVLVVSCPCSFGIATPLALASGARAAADRRILLSNADVVERVADSAVIVFDKTGTLTTGEFRLEGTIAADGECTDRVLARAAAVERRSSHPLAEAIVDAAGENSSATVEGFDREGRRVSATVDGTRVTVGHPEAFDDDWTIPPSVSDALDESLDVGIVPVAVGWDRALRGVITVRDAPRAEWESVVADLATDDRTIVVLTGDDERMAEPFEAHPDVDEVFACVRPESKEAIVRRMRTGETTTMIGDGTNDAPALASADLGIALGSGTDLAADAADVVVVDDDLSAIPTLFEITRSTRRRIRRNLAWALGYNAVAVPIAVAGLINPLIAAVAMTVSSLAVVANSGRLSSLGTSDRRPHSANSAGADGGRAGTRGDSAESHDDSIGTRRDSADSHGDSVGRPL